MPPPAKSRKKAVASTEPIARRLQTGKRGRKTKQVDDKPNSRVSMEPLSKQPHRWTFLTNHAHVLIVLRAQPEMVLREVAHQVGITERAVQRIIQDLETAGFIRRQKIGRQNQYEVLADQPLRHPIEAHRTIGDLLRLINE
jgi:predicted transcriptional regulator